MHRASRRLRPLARRNGPGTLVVRGGRGRSPQPQRPRAAGHRPRRAGGRDGEQRRRL